MNSENKNIDPIRHTLAHLLAYTVKQLFPGSQNAIGPVIEDGFYQDFEIKGKISEADLPRIQDAMVENLKNWEEMRGREVDLSEALQIFKDNKYKCELATEFSSGGKTLTVYTAGDFEDLCKGGHCEHPSNDVEPTSFKLTRLAGAYWRGDEKNIMLTRIYGVAFTSKEGLDEYLAKQEEAKENDHRKLGKELDLFFITEEVGAGLPLLTPRGEKIKQLLSNYMRQEEEARGYQYVATPVLTQEKLYQRSGHADYYLDDMYSTEKDEEGNKFYIKPMNCPHHHMIFEHMIESYKQLPLRLSEHAGLYRYELSGTLTGLIRVRGPITQNDSHIYVTPDQLEGEFTDLINFFKQTYQLFDIQDYWFRVSLPDFSKDKYSGDKEKWVSAAELIINVLKKLKMPYVEEIGEAAFYGPKLDVQIKNVLGKEDTIATAQVDILVPGRMQIEYTNAEGRKENPIVIHKSICGSFERFMGFILEKSKGNLPFWLTPEQIRVIPINDTVKEYVDEITTLIRGITLNQPLKYNELRFSIDNKKDSLGKKINSAAQLRIPIILIVGPRDVENRTVSFKTEEGEEVIQLSQVEEYINKTS